MRLIDADHLKRWILSRVFKTRLSIADVIDQIDREDTIEPDPDTVSKAQVLETFSDLYFIFDDYKEIQKEFDAVYEKLRDLPPSPSRPQAEMIQESYYSNKLVCSNCGIEARWDYEFCPYCGFKFKQTGGAV